MPHFILNYARPMENTVDVQKVCETISEGANESGLFTPAAIKVRAIPVDHYVVGEKGKADFMHVQARMFTGRTPDQKRALFTILTERLATLLAGNDVAFSMEAIDMDKDTYAKGL